MNPASTTPLSGGMRARAAGNSTAPSKLLGNWQLHQPLAEGALTKLYTARPLGCPPSWPADYVVKVLRADMRRNPAALMAMRREAEVGRQCSHPNLVPILETHVDSDWPHIVMPRLEGASLAMVIERVGKLV
ncbi:MAG: hypothetical protein KDB23_25065, partial [Planctomycetales bacterium]|nr:hypothetical protein [Planctomycetales bacterium]